MTDLRALQEGLLAALYADRSDPAAASRLGLAAGSRLDVYRANLVHGIVAALAQTFGATEGLLGHDNFRYLVRRCLLETPLTGDLDDYGAVLPPFLRGAHELGSLPMAADLAALEWAMDRSFRVAERPPADGEVLAAAAAHPDEVRLAAQPSLRLVDSRHRLFAAWSELRDGRRDRLEPADLEPGRERLVTWNRDGQVIVAPVDGSVAAILRGLSAGRPLPRLLDEAPFDAAPEGFSQAIATAWTRGWIVSAS